MHEANAKSDVSEDLLGRLNVMLERISEASENQVRLLDERLKELQSRGEVATERLIKAIEQGVRAQIDSLADEIEQLRRRIGEIRGGTERKKTSKAKVAGKKAAAKKAERKVAKKTATKSPKKKAVKQTTKKAAKKASKR